MYQECPHGIVAGTCCWCMAQALEHEQRAIEGIRQAVTAREAREARERARGQGNQGKGRA